MKTFNNILELIGNTPIVKLNKIKFSNRANIYVKLEYFNPLSSVKDRIALNMIEDAEKSGRLKTGSVIIEPTSGNTGIGLAYVCAVKGYKLLITMPESMSIERRKIMKAFGAEIVLTPASEGMPGAIKKANEIANEYDDSFIPGQFDNNANPDIHRKSTAIEILEAMDKKIDFFVAGVGTGGTITGVGEVLKKELDDVSIVAVEPEDSPVLSGGSPGPHKIQGIGAGFIPEILNTKVIDKIIKVSNIEAIETAREIAKLEGIFCGISSGAAIVAAQKIAENNPGKNILALLPSGGERYLSTDLFNFEV